MTDAPRRAPPASEASRQHPTAVEAPRPATPSMVAARRLRNRRSRRSGSAAGRSAAHYSTLHVARRACSPDGGPGRDLAIVAAGRGAGGAGSLSTAPAVASDDVILVGRGIVSPVRAGDGGVEKVLNSVTEMVSTLA